MNILLIMPNFFDYPQEITKELENMGYVVDYFDDRPSTNGIIKAIIRVKKDLIVRYIKSYFNKIMEVVSKTKYDVVFLISGQSLSFNADMIKKIKEAQTSARFVLYQWDSLKNFPSIKNIQNYFNKCYSFDREDVSNNENLKFLPLFYSRRYENIGSNKLNTYEYDFSFVGTAHPKKYKFIKLMSDQMKDVYPHQFIYFFFPSRIVYLYRKIANPELRKANYSEFHFTPLSGVDMENIIINSKCILDSAQDGQVGLTIRVIESLGAKKKLITTNRDIVNYDFYREENIYVYTGVIDYNAKFFACPYVEIEEEIYEEYSLRKWLAEILS